MVPLTVASAASVESGRDGEAGAIRELADHRLRHGNLRVIELRLVFEDGHSEGMDRIRQMRGGAEGVISATGDGKQSKATSKTRRPRMLWSIVAFRPRVPRLRARVECAP